VKDDAAAIGAALDAALASGACSAVLLTGGTGVAPRDVTPEAVGPRLERALPGFGELFRSLSFAEIGAAAMASRALAGVARGKPVFALPGSRAAIRLALERLILPELGHLVAEAGKRG
jgi:molybdenum cofactor biosynthesis protein B